MTILLTGTLTCEAEDTRILSSGMTPPCEKTAVGKREMICRSGTEVLPVLPACAKHLRQKLVYQFEDWAN